MRVLVETNDLVTPGAKEEIESLAESRRKAHRNRFKGLGGKPGVAAGGSPNMVKPASPGMNVGITVDKPRKTPGEQYTRKAE